MAEPSADPVALTAVRSAAVIAPAVIDRADRLAAAPVQADHLAAAPAQADHLAEVPVPAAADFPAAAVPDGDKAS